MYRVILEVTKTHPACSAGYGVGERITLEHDMVVMERTDRICPYALAAMLPYLPLLGHVTPPEDSIGSTPSERYNARIPRVPCSSQFTASSSSFS